MKFTEIRWGPILTIATLIMLPALVYTTLIKPYLLHNGDFIDIKVVDKVKKAENRDPFESNPEIRYMLDLGYKPKNPEIETNRDGLIVEYLVPVTVEMYNAVEKGAWYSMRIYPRHWDWHIYEIGPALNR